nr:cupin domain-containing protein [Candidatus Bathyarchaeota archaeon]
MPVWRKRKAVKAGEGVWRRTLATGEKMMIVEFSFEAGAKIPTHSHPHEQVGYVVEGEIKLVVDGKEYTLEEGDSYLIPPNTEHSATTPVRAKVVDVFSPPREDYL